MASDWVVPTVDDVKSCFTNIFVEQDNDADKVPSDLVTAWLPVIIAQVRQEIINANRNKISTTANSVPPEAKKHVLVLVAEACIINSARMVQFIETQPMKRMLDDAYKFLEEVKRGKNVTDPQDAQVDQDQLPTGTVWGDRDSDFVGSETTQILDMTVDGPTV